MIFWLPPLCSLQEVAHVLCYHWHLWSIIMIILCYLMLWSFPLPYYVLSRECAVLSLTSEEHHNDNVMVSYVMIMLSFPLPNYVLSRESPISGMFRWESHQPSSLHHFVITIQHHCQHYILSSNFNSLCYHNLTSLSTLHLVIQF